MCLLRSGWTFTSLEPLAVSSWGSPAVAFVVLAAVVTTLSVNGFYTFHRSCSSSGDQAQPNYTQEMLWIDSSKALCCIIWEIQVRNDYNLTFGS